MSFAVFVTIRIKPDFEERFLERMKKQATDSTAYEVGCHAFEVWYSRSSPNVIQLYEIYEDAEDFAKHLESDHFLSFDNEVADMVEEKTVSSFDRLFEP